MASGSVLSATAGSSTTKVPAAGKYKLNIGQSFVRKSPATATSTLRYDFKPTSIENSEVYLARGHQGEATVVVPTSKTDTNSLAVYKGSEKAATERDCLLIFDHKTGEFTIEQLSTNVQVKKVRGSDASEHLPYIKTEIERLRKLNSKPVVEKPVEKPIVEETAASVLGDVEEMDSSGSGSSSSSEDDDDEEMEPVEPPKPSDTCKDSSAASAPAPTASASQLHEDLQLSESSDDEE